MNQTKVKKRVIGVVIRLEETVCAVVDVKGDILAKDSFPTTDYPEVNGFVVALTKRILDMVEANGGFEEVRSVGISAPSGHFLSGSMVNSPNMPWKGVIPLSVMLQDQLGMAVAVANNAYVTGLAEHAYGSARGMHDFVVVTLGTGIGSSVFSNGQPHFGFGGFAGEIGHTCVEVGGRKCGCGNHGCLEAYCSKCGLRKTVEEVIAESDEPTLLSGLSEPDVLSVAKCCEKGDKAAIEAFRRVGDKLGMGLANYASILNPEAFILTGDMTQAGEWLLKPMRQSFDEHVFKNIKDDTRILVSILKEGERDLLGASALAWDVKEYSLFK